MQAKAKWVWVIAGAGSLWAGVLLVLGLLVPWLGAQPLPGQVLLWGGLWAAGTATASLAWRYGVERPQRQLARLTEQVRVACTMELAPPLQGRGPLAQALAQQVQTLAAQRDRLRQDMAQQVQQASVRVQQEKDRLAALIAELQQSVLVCNLDGRILLYNHRARTELGAAHQGPVVGMGRSVYALLDRGLMQHALHTIGQRLARGTGRAVAQFVTYTPSGQWLRVQMTPVLTQQNEQGRALSGFVLLLDDVTQSFAQEHERDSVLHSLTEGNRASLAAMRNAVQQLRQQAGDGPLPEQLLHLVQEEMGRMGERIDALAARSAQALQARWPLQEMLGQEFLAAAQHHLAERLPCPLVIAPAPDELWLRLDSYSLLQVLQYLGQRLVDEFAVRSLELRLQPASDDAQAPRAHLDLVWTGHAMSTETVMSWEMDPMAVGSGHSTWSVREVVARHRGQMWFERERVRHTAFFRFALPLEPVPSAPEETAAIESRPEFYDFDLFQHEESDSAWEQRPLASLRYTVFDTETTGLNPSGGDQILQIGAVRIVNGKLLAHENFDQLVHPGRSIPKAGIPIHGITPEMVADQPRIEAVLPVFQRFAEDSVLVAHNAAFDMKFLQMLEPRTGIAFRQPVLDTLLLSAVVHPHQESHRLEALAERFGIPVLGRHTALGDAMVTAEVWLHLLGQLQAMGIHTLGQAREAAQQTYFARLKY